MRLINQENTVSNLDTAYAESNESEELANHAKELKQQKIVAKKDMNSEIASKTKESNAEEQKRKEVTAEMEKAQTELKRIKREIEAFEEIKIGMSDLKHIFLI